MRHDFASSPIGASAGPWGFGGSIANCAYRVAMPTVRVEQAVDAPRDALFAVLSDHEGYGRFPGVRKCELIETGSTERNGLGALRRVYLGGPTVLDEEIVAYDAPHHFEYRIVRARPVPVKHTLGRLEFEAIGPNRTRVVWTTTFDIRLPIIGRSISNRAAVQFTRAFKKIIRVAAGIAARQAA